MHTTAEMIAAELVERGYKEIDHPRLKPGGRVRHVGELYPEAAVKGTARIHKVLKRREKDIELAIVRDDGTGAQWADYHTMPVSPL